MITPQEHNQQNFIFAHLINKLQGGTKKELEGNLQI